MSDWGLAFHAVQSAKDLLAKAGFQEIKVLRDTPTDIAMEIVAHIGHRKKIPGPPLASLVASTS